jgi:hypothetical protein
MENHQMFRNRKETLTREISCFIDRKGAPLKKEALLQLALCYSVERSESPSGNLITESTWTSIIQVVKTEVVHVTVAQSG